MPTSTGIPSFSPLPLPAGVVSRIVDCTATCGLTFHTITAGTPGKALVLLLHGYPELAYSWRKVIKRIAELGDGFYCVAPDLRGFGRTLGWSNSTFQETDLREFSSTNVVRDLVSLVHTLGYQSVYSVIGNDLGSFLSACAVMLRPDLFRSCVQMAVPARSPGIPVLGDPACPDAAPTSKPKLDLPGALAQLNPPKKHYQWYLSTEQAVQDWDSPPQGLETFLGSYLYSKSASWSGNRVHALEPFSAQSMAASMPQYYIMPMDKTMPEVMIEMGIEDAAGSMAWLPRSELRVYVSEYGRTGFLGGLSYYRAVTTLMEHELLLFANRTIDVPLTFMAGECDWAPHLFPGAWSCFDDTRAVKAGCYRGAKVVPGSGHYLPQEQPDAVVGHISEFFATLS
ncbi:hypothetical protein PG985_000354 [Apiospora marii]|uniref:AB hydrolase-1 domain-containing protein n=1 Tax=Apiospora marii TaxID=335849 RepID=A0ABR1R1T5_9PEZI